MRDETFWGGMAVGIIAGLVMGLLLAVGRYMSPMERTRARVGGTARRAVRSARGTWRELAGRFSG